MAEQKLFSRKLKKRGDRVLVLPPDSNSLQQGPSLFCSKCILCLRFKLQIPVETHLYRKTPLL